MTQRDPVHRLLAGLRPAPPPAGTRERALAAARRAASQPPAVEDLWTRLWCSRPLRLAWGAAVAALLLAHLLLSVRGPARPGALTIARSAAGHSAAEPELAAIAKLPPLRLGLLPHIDPFGRGGAPPHTSQPS